MKPGVSIAVVLAAACANLEVARFAAPPVRTEFGAAEARLWDVSDEFERRVTGTSLLLDDPALERYVQGVLARLFPEFPGCLRVRILRSPEVNAFTFPNGLVCVHAGLLSLLGNEAQLASVLAHEGAHFELRHGLERREQTESSLVRGVFLDVIPSAGKLLTASSISGFSRAQEREADREGFERLGRAGYDRREAVVTFQRLLARAEAIGAASPLFFASHPALRERVASYQALAEAARASEPSLPTERGEQAYLVATAHARRTALEEDLARRAHASALAALAIEDERLGAAEARTFRAEALRLRAGAGDLEAARASLREALALEPDHAPALRALGRVAARIGDYAEARACLARYLELAPKAPDLARERAFVEAELAALPLPTP